VADGRVKPVLGTPHSAEPEPRSGVRGVQRALNVAQPPESVHEELLPRVSVGSLNNGHPVCG